MLTFSVYALVEVDEQSPRHTSTPKGRFVLRADAIRPYNCGGRAADGAGTIETPELHWHLRRSFDDCYLISAEQTPRKSWAASWAEAYLPNAYCVMQEHHLLTMAGVTSP